MKKDTAYSMRMSSSLLHILKRAAHKDRRTVASLLNKIILDYLEKEDLIQSSDSNGERRRFQRMKIALPATAKVKTPSQVVSLPTVTLNISLGGVLVTYPREAGIVFTSMSEPPHFELSFKLPQSDDQIQIPCEASRLHNMFIEIQIGAKFSNPDEKDLRRLQTFLM